MRKPILDFLEVLKILCMGEINSCSHDNLFVLGNSSETHYLLHEPEFAVPKVGIMEYTHFIK